MSIETGQTPQLNDQDVGSHPLARHLVEDAQGGVIIQPGGF